MPVGLRERLRMFLLVLLVMTAIEIIIGELRCTLPARRVWRFVEPGLELRSKGMPHRRTNDGRLHCSLTPINASQAGESAEVKTIWQARFDLQMDALASYLGVLVTFQGG
jgi:hypothetical protein